MSSSQSTCDIRVQGLTKQFGRRRVVSDLSFTVEPGRITGFLGPNGAGKTTTLRMLLGLMTPSEGTALIGGRRYEDLGSPGWTVGALLEANGFHPGRSGRDHLRTYAVGTGVSDARVDEILGRVGLTDAARQHVRGYSLGMRQRLGVAAALLTDPPVLICDEPTNGLDPEGIRWLRGLLRERAARGHTVLVSSHLLAEMQQLVDSVVIINHGRLVHEGPLDDIGAHTVRVTSLNATALHEAISARAGGEAVIERTDESTLRVDGFDAEQIGVTALHAGVAITQLVTEANNLEQLFFSLTEADQQDVPAPSSLTEEAAK